MKRVILGILLCALFAFPIGCTIRYSHTVGGSIPSGEFFKVVNSSDGVDVGFGTSNAYQNGLSGIAFSDPDGAKAVANYPCEVLFSEVDYRSRFYAYYIRADFPKVQVTTYCLKQKKVASQ